MAKRILLFPGQGSQYIGMGKALTEGFAPARELLQIANKVLGFDLEKILFNGPEEELKKTHITQPAIFVISMMAYQWLKEKKVPFDFVAGHSLGEYSALCAAGAFSFEQGLALVKLRGELMSQAGEKMPGAMAAILGLEEPVLREILVKSQSAGIVVAANFNSPSQIVISGTQSGVQEAMRLAELGGAKKVVPLAVSGAFHSPLMEYAVAGLAEGLKKITFHEPLVPLITNVDATPCQDAERLKALLLRQMTSPVRWVESIQKAIQLECTDSFEIGPGKVLMGLVRGISRELKVTPLEAPVDLVF